MKCKQNDIFRCNSFIFGSLLVYLFCPCLRRPPPFSLRGNFLFHLIYYCLFHFTIYHFRANFFCAIFVIWFTHKWNYLTRNRFYNRVLTLENCFFILPLNCNIIFKSNLRLIKFNQFVIRLFVWTKWILCDTNKAISNQIKSNQAATNRNSLV